jgi:predicted Ser/Thr protein kinase
VARTVGRYEILQELGRGGMATVYLARQTDLDRLVALKELSALRQSDPAFTRRFLRESRLTGSLSHPNIVTVHDYFENDGVPYIAMEYVDGGSLRPHIGQLALTQVTGVLEGILAGLDHAERRSIVHRDLKPENVMLTSDGRVKVADFGIAKATRTAQQTSVLTGAGMTVGTPNYMAPEQAMGQDLGPWTDLYSVGVMAFELFVGHVPFHDTEEPMAVLMRQVSDPIPPARSVNPEVDPAISGWIERLVVKEPAGRMQSAAEAWDELEEIAIALVGPRWRRSARVLEPSRRPPDTPMGPATPPPTAAARPPLMPTLGVPDIADEAPTRRLDEREEAALAETYMPQPRTRRLDEPEEPSAARSGNRRSGAGMFVKAGLLLVAFVVGLAAAFGGGSSTPGGPAPSAPAASVPGQGGTTPAGVGAGGTGSSDPGAGGTAPSEAYASALNGTFGALEQATDSDEANLEQAETLAGQAAAARALASEYDGAAAQLGALNLGSGDRRVNDQLVAALRGTASAYRRAARAASSGNPDRYRTASAAIPGAKVQLNGALGGLQGAGYQPAAPAAPPSASPQQPAEPAAPRSDVGDSRSDDPSDDSADP